MVMTQLETLEVVSESVQQPVKFDTREDGAATYDAEDRVCDLTCIRQEVERLAYFLWQNRGCPEGSADEDWYRAEQLMQSKPPEP